MVKIGSIIKDLRSQKGWTQLHLAEKMNVSDKTISKWEGEKGFPGIEMLPELSKILGVSIDYLVTGKNSENIIFMSTMEHCAKTDDPSMLDKFYFDAIDEHRKGIISYAKEYQSKKVIAEIIRTKGFDSLVQRNNSREKAIVDSFDECLYYAVLTNTVACLIEEFQKSRSECLERDSNIKSSLDHLERIGLDWQHLIEPEKSLYEKYCRTFYDKISDLTEADFEKELYVKIFDLLLDSSIVNDETRDLLLSFDSNPLWISGIQEFFHLSVKREERETADKYFKRIEKYNSPKIKMLEELNLKHGDKTELCWGTNGSSLTEYGKAKRDIGVFIPIPQKTIRFLIESGDLKQAEKYHKYNASCGFESIDNDILHGAKLKANKNTTEQQIKIQSAIHNGILNVDEILATEDYKTIKEAIENYPIHEIELTKSLSSLVFIPKDVYSNYNGRVSILGLNSKYILKYFQSIEIEPNIYSRESLPQTVAEGLELIEKVKCFIVKTGKEEFDKEDVIRPLTKEFFLKQLEDGNLELAIIKLYVRLEAILKGTYHYKGDFISMLNCYCNEHEQCWDNDREEYYDTEICSYLHKLRISRNNLVHAENITESMTKEDIVKCIDYICNLK